MEFEVHCGILRLMDDVTVVDVYLSDVEKHIAEAVSDLKSYRAIRRDLLKQQAIITTNKQAFELIIEQGRPIDEVAAELGIPPKKVLNRACKFGYDLADRGSSKARVAKLIGRQYQQAIALAKELGLTQA